MMTRAVLLMGAAVFVLGAVRATGAVPAATPEALRKLATEYYGWRDQSYPVSSSSQGLHTWDDRLADFSSGAVAARRKRVADLVAQVRAIPSDSWSKDDRIDWLLNSPGGTHLVARIIISPGHMKRVIGALTDNLSRFEQQHGGSVESEFLRRQQSYALGHHGVRPVGLRQ